MLIDWLKSEIDRRAIKQIDLGRALGLSESMMSKVFLRHRRLTGEELAEALRYLGYPLPLDDTPAARLMRAAAELEPDDLEHVSRLAERLRSATR